MLFALSMAGTACTSSALEPVGPEGDQPRTQSQAPALSSMSPLSGPVGTEVTISGNGFARRNNHAAFGRGYIRNLESSDGTTLRFIVPDGLDLCAPDATGPCPGAYPPVTPGDYVITILLEGQKSNSVTFTVTR